MKNRTLWIAIGIVVLLILFLWPGYNGLVTAQQEVKGSWAKVEAQYQRRFDLVPNLVKTVQGAAQFEQSTLQNVTAARTGWQNASSRDGRIAAAEQLDSAISRLLVTVEAYPQLKATQAFQDLMTQLEGTENRISTARIEYNDVVTSYNVRVKRFPTNILAALFGFSEEAFFENQPGAENAPVVDFGTTSSAMQ